MIKLFDKAFFKMLLGFIAILVLGIGSIYAVSFFGPQIASVEHSEAGVGLSVEE